MDTGTTVQTTIVKTIRTNPALEDRIFERP
jgi:hypothetical protein